MKAPIYITLYTLKFASPVGHQFLTLSERLRSTSTWIKELPRTARGAGRVETSRFDAPSSHAPRPQASRLPRGSSPGCEAFRLMRNCHLHMPYGDSLPPAWACAPWSVIEGGRPCVSLVSAQAFRIAGNTILNRRCVYGPAVHRFSARSTL